MECEKANNLMMKFMDNNTFLSGDEQNMLAEHLMACANCNEDYIIYRQIMDQFQDCTDILEAPLGFEQQVMKKVTRITPNYLAGQSTEAATGLALGALAIFVGISIIISSYGTYIINAAAGYPAAYSFCIAASNAFKAAASSVNNLSLAAMSLFDMFVIAVQNMRQEALTVTVILLAMQYVVRVKGKSGARESAL